ncbi:hypothetical protein [Streptomyces fructofermentans]|uniref:hypothetical protein n=1 Tax=Streptomyces fructofermentans TaxID=152141 RepID=UPI0037A0CD31
MGSRPQAPRGDVQLHAALVGLHELRAAVPSSALVFAEQQRLHQLPATGATSAVIQLTKPPPGHEA